MENFISFIQDSIKAIENMEIEDKQKSLLASRLDSICAILQITIIQLKQNENEKS